MIFAGVIMAIGGMVVIAVGRAGRRGMLSPNAMVGIRTSATTASDEAWYAAHEAGGRWISIGGWIITVGGIIIFLARPEAADATRIALWSAVLGAAAVLYGGYVGHRAASELPESGTH